MRLALAASGAAGIGETLGRVSDNDAKELLTALLTAPADHSSSLAGMSTCVGGCSTGWPATFARKATRTRAYVSEAACKDAAGERS